MPGRSARSRKIVACGDEVPTKLTGTVSTFSTGIQMQKPSFTETMQIGIVVRDLDATVKKYGEDYGIGPWQFHEFNPGDLKDLREYGKPVTHSTRIATTMIGQVQWELIEPLDDESTFARFLAEKGEGVHHIAVRTPNFEETVAMPAKQGKELALSCTFSDSKRDIKIAYLPTDQDLGVLIEIFSGMPETKNV